jgi:cysteine desulfuration protein SufE
MTIDEIESDLELLDDWEERYRYLIDLGKTLEPLSDGERSLANKVQGCVSQVWLVTEVAQDDRGTPRLVFRGDSDAMIVRGLIALLIAMYSGKTADDIAAIDAGAVFKRLGLGEHLTPLRSNGLNSMVMRVRSDAARAAAVAG